MTRQWSSLSGLKKVTLPSYLFQASEKTIVSLGLITGTILLVGCVSTGKDTRSVSPSTSTPVLSSSRPETKPIVPTKTDSPTSTSTPINSNKLVLTVDKGLVGTFSLAPDGSIWINVSLEAGTDELWHYDTKGNLVEKFYLFSPGKLDGIQDFEVTNSDIWILDHAGWRPSEQVKIVRLGLDGTIQADYLIPTRILFGSDGEYYESGVNQLLIDQTGNVILDTVSGLYRFFNSEGKVDPVRLKGYIYDRKVYKIINHGQDSQPCVIQIGDQSVEVSNNENNWCKDIIGFSPDGSFYVLLGNLAERKESVLHINASGELIDAANVAYAMDVHFPPVFPSNYKVGPDGQAYAMIYRETDGSWQILRLQFSKELLPTRETLPMP